MSYSIISSKEVDERKKQEQLDEVMLVLRKPPNTTPVKERHLSPDLANILLDPCA